jgi:serine/threonine-protein kinase RsbT
VADEVESVIPIESDSDVVTARQQARAMASRLDLSSTDQTLLATAISEVARNITAYAERGEVLLSVIQDDGGRRGIRVIARDEGPGIENVELALQDGFTSGSGLGLGLPGARRLVHHFEIETAPGRGTKVTLVMWERERARAA